MKDVNEILRRRLQMLEALFSSAWLSDFSDFIRFVHTNELTQQILKEIKNQKEEAYASLERHLKGLLEDGKKCLQELQKAFHFNEGITSAILALLKIKINSKEIANPFCDLESIYRKYCADFASLFKLITEEGLTAAIPKYCHQNGSNPNSTIDPTLALTFSPYFQKCKQNIEALSGQHASSVWGRWDELMRWAEWTKNGVSSTNDEFGHNLAEMFHEYKISEVVQSCGLFFLEQLASTQTVAVDSEVCLKALELFLDQDDQYWIIVHFGGEKGEKSEFFIKRLQREAQSYTLLELLLEAEPYSPIEFPRLTHTLGELEIKNELKKVFFPHKKFAGSLVQLNELDIAVDATAILKSLSSLQEHKKYHPTFNYRYYHHCTLARV